MDNPSIVVQEASVLLIDDDATTGNLFRLIFEDYRPTDRFHFNLYIVETGHAGLAALDSMPSPDFVLIDLKLPDMNGVELFKEVQTRRLADNSIFVATSAYHTIDTSTILLLAGFDAFVPKPIAVGQIKPQFARLARDRQQKYFDQRKRIWTSGN